MIVEISAEAEADLIDIFEFIGRDSETFAFKVTDDILDACERVGHFPYSGVVSPKQDNPNVREIYFGRYRIAYLIRSNSVYVLAVKHTARDRES